MKVAVQSHSSGGSTVGRGKGTGCGAHWGCGGGAEGRVVVEVVVRDIDGGEGMEELVRDGGGSS